MEFKKENRYLVVKLSDVELWPGHMAASIRYQLEEAAGKVAFQREKAGKPPLECLVIESDWPEYESTWEEIQRRMEDKPTIMDEEMGRWQDEIYKLCCSLAPDAQIDGGGCDSGDPLDLTTDEIAQAFAYWDNLLFDTLESVSHAKAEGLTFRAAAAMITTLADENEKLQRQVTNLLDGESPVCGDCDGSGWLYNRVEGRYACTCMTEAEPYQIMEERAKILEDSLDRILDCGFGDCARSEMRDIAHQGLAAVRNGSEHQV